MDTLPLELQQRICSCLTPKDLKPLRLASKTYAIAACRYFLPRIFLFNHQDSFQEIKDIAGHPILSQRVTTLVIDTSRFASCPNFDDWCRLYKPSGVYAPDWADFEPPEVAQGKTDARTQRALRRAKVAYEEALKKSPYTADELKGYWKAYQYMAAAQVQESSKALMSDSLALAFLSFPRLTNLIITYGDLDGFDTGKRTRMFHGVPVSIKAQRKRWYWDVTTGLMPTGFSFWELIQAAHQVDRALKSLVILDVQFEGFERLPSTTIFRDLKHFRHRDNCRYFGNANFLVPIISSAQALESVGLVDGPYNESITNFIGASSSTSLLRCSFANFKAREDDLVQFLLRYAGSLENLRLAGRCKLWAGSSLLNPGDWVSFAARVRGRLPNLKRIQLSRLDKPRLPSARGFYAPPESLNTEEILENHEHVLETAPMDLEDGLWEDYEEIFFPQ